MDLNEGELCKFLSFKLFKGLNTCTVKTSVFYLIFIHLYIHFFSQLGDKEYSFICVSISSWGHKMWKLQGYVYFCKPQYLHLKHLHTTEQQDQDLAPLLNTCAGSTWPKRHAFISVVLPVFVSVEHSHSHLQLFLISNHNRRSWSNPSQ